MPQDFPDDIWTEIVNVHFSDASARDTLLSLSLTSARIRKITIPKIYHSLVFRVALAAEVETRVLFTSLIRQYMRAKHLMNTRGLLPNVRRLSLEHWDVKVKVTRHRAYGYGDMESSSRGNSDKGNPDKVVPNGTKNMMAAIYDMVARLVPHMPGLRELQLIESMLTPFFYAMISARPFLTSLHIEMLELPYPERHIPATLPQTLRVRDLHYSYVFQDMSRWRHGDLKMDDPYAAHILEHSISSLERLTLNVRLVPLLASYIANKTLSLQVLDVSTPTRAKHGPNSFRDAADSLWPILLVSPRLRSLAISGVYLGPRLSSDVDPHLPHLVELSAPPLVLQRLTEGRNLHKVCITQEFTVRAQPITQCIRCSPIHLRELSMTEPSVVPSPHELFDFIQSFSVFCGLESLDLAYHPMGGWRRVSYEDFLEASTAIESLLLQLVCLRTCQIYDTQPAVFWDATFNNIGPSLGLSPLPREHASLQMLGVDFFSDKAWYRDPELGWVQKEWENPNVRESRLRRLSFGQPSFGTIPLSLHY